MSDLASFGEWIRRRRRALDLTREALARQVGCAVVTIRKIETDERRPSRQVAERLAACLQLPLEQQAAFLEAARGVRAVDRLPAAPPLEQPVLVASEPATRTVGAPVAEQRTSASDSATPAYTRPAHNLPAQLTALLGREHALEELGGLLERPEVRLITITGPGGTGKTRLALQVSTDQLRRFPDGAWFVDLAAIRHPELIMPAIARSLAVAEPTGVPLREHLIAHLQHKRLLLVLDNFEHVIDGAVELAALLAGAPHVKALSTSRSPLHLRGEYCYELGPLALPPQATPAMLMTYPATALFIERAQAVRQSFAVTEASAAPIAAICERLDGLPLAIELAAARMSLFTPEQLLARLERPLALLTRGARDLPPRQQTLHNVIDWSYQLLNADEQRLFRRLGVFVGGCTLESAQSVCIALELVETDQSNDRAPSLNSHLATPTLDVLGALLEKSLLRQADGVNNEPRFVMLETIREYAAGQLAASGESELVERAHAEHYLALAEAGEMQFKSGAQRQWVEQMDAEIDNMRSALKWSQAACAESALGLRLANALFEYWSARGSRREARGWYEQLQAGAPAPLRAQALLNLGLIVSDQGDDEEANRLVRAALALFEELNSHPGIASSHYILGMYARAQADYSAAQDHFNQSLRYREPADAWGQAPTVRMLGSIHRTRGESAAARECYGRAIAIQRQLGDQESLARTLINLGQLEYYEGNYGAAIALYGQALTHARYVGNGENISRNRYECARALIKQQQYAAAEALGQQQLADSEQPDAPLDRRAEALWILGWLALLRGELDRSKSQLIEALSLLRSFGASYTMETLELLELIAQLVLARGTPARALRLWAVVGAYRERIGAPRPPSEQGEFDQSVAVIRVKLDVTVFEQAWAAGQALSLEQAVADAQTA